MQIRIRIPRRIPANVAQQVAVDERPTRSRRLSGSLAVALGILLSRIAGLIRERVVAHFFGESGVADAFRAAIRIPNLLNNLFGEGVLSASFITVYSKLRALGQDDEAEHVAAAVFGILALVSSALALFGALFTPILIDLIAPGFKGDIRELTIRIVRILFPGTSLLVMSAWCLGVLNSHRQFLLSYTAPVAMNATMIAVLLIGGPRSTQSQLALDLAWGSVLGAALLFLVQLPRVLGLVPGLRPNLDVRSAHVQSVLRNFGPIFVSRGVVQISAYVDSMIASLLPTGAVAALGYGQVISVLPISLFSMSVSAAELPAFSSVIGTRDEIADRLRERLGAGLRRIAFLVVPSAVAFLVLGDIVAAAVYQSGRFHHADAVYVWAVLAGSAVGLPATGLGRLYSSAFYAIFDTRTPLRFAMIRVALTIALGVICALFVPRWLGIDPKWGIGGLTASAGIAGWVEFTLLRTALNRRIGKAPLSAGFLARLWLVAFLGAGVAYWIKRAMGVSHPILLACAALGLYGAIYFGGTAMLGVPEARRSIRSIAVKT